MELANFLLARIDSDEKAARAAAPMWNSQPWNQIDVPAREHAENYWSPEVVLAECAAKRRIIERCAEMYDQEEAGYHDRAPMFALELLQAFALPYADHPDYQQEWRP